MSDNNTIFPSGTEVDLSIFKKDNEDPKTPLRRHYLSLVGLLQYVDIINGDLTGQELPEGITEDIVKGMVYHCVGDLDTREAMLNGEGGETEIDSVEDLENLENPEEVKVKTSNSEVVAAMTDNTRTYKALDIVGSEEEPIEVESTVYMNANENIKMDNVEVSGDKGSTNGKINISAPQVSISNVSVKDGSTVYNVFEGSQTNPMDKFEADGVTCNDRSLKHNIFNIYNVNDNAVINIKNVDANLDVDNSNVLRISNLSNATNVTVNMENVNWNYEPEGEGNRSTPNFDYAGLIIYQPFGSDEGITEEGLDAMKTWKFNFKNCKYNGVVVVDNNMGEHNQVMYCYGVGGNKVKDPVELGLNLNFNTTSQEISWSFITDETSWNESYQNGGLKKYYQKYPEEDWWNTIADRACNYNDRVYEGTIGEDNVTCSVEWASNDAQKITIGENTYYGAIFYGFEPQDVELFNDVALEESANKTLHITSIHYNGDCEQCWKGAINAPGAVYPWAVIDNVGDAKVEMYYDDQVCYPWGKSVKSFGFGCASIPNELKDAGFISESEANDMKVNEAGEAVAPVDTTKIKFIAIKAK